MKTILLSRLLQIVTFFSPALALAAADAAAIPTKITLSGCPVTDYYAPMQVGTQTFEMLIDSGSTTLAVAGSKCRSCTGITPKYQPGSAAKPQNRTARSMYGDGSGWVGSIYQDVAGFPGATQDVAVVMADITQQNQFFTNNSCVLGTDGTNSYQGILGVGPIGLAVRGTNAFVTDLHTGGGNPNNGFAVQLCDKGGSLWFGGYDPAAITGAFEYTAMDSTSPFYAVAVDSVLVGGENTGITTADMGSSVVDTGTTELVLPTDVYEKLIPFIEGNRAFQEQVAGSTSGWFNQGACNTASLSQEELDAQLPHLSLTFPGPNGTTVTVDAPATQSYLLPLLDQSGNINYCPGVAEGYQTILGSAFLRSRLTHFDVANSRVGFAPHVGCPQL